MELLVEGELVPAAKLQPLRSECGELVAIFVTIIRMARESAWAPFFLLHCSFALSSTCSTTSPRTGSMALLLANGSMSSGSGGEGEIRRALIEADLVECMVALPGQLFTNTQIPACIWFLTKNKRSTSVPLVTSADRNRDGRATFRDRTGQTLFIDARKLGFMKDRVLRDFTAEDLEKITGTIRKWN